MNKTRNIIYLSNFIFTFGLGLAIYINSSFLSSFVGEGMTGIVYALGSLGSIVAILIAPAIFKKIGGYKFLLLVTFLDALSFLGVSLVQNPWGIVLLFIFGFSFNTLIVFSLDEFLKISSQNASIGKIRGSYLAIIHLALIGAQLSILTFLSKFPYQTIYFVAFLAMLVFLLVSYWKLKEIPEPNYDKLKTVTFVKKFFKNKNLRRGYGFSFLVNFFYSWMLIYTPIYLIRHLGFTLGEVSAIFMFMLLPFLFMPIWTGRLADKIGERKLLMFGFAIASIAVFSIYFQTEKILWIWALLLFLSRVGISTTESMSDTYFFKHINAENEEFVGVYRSASPAANILGPLCAVLLFIFLPSFNYIYLILSAIMLYGVYLSSTIRKSDI